MLKFLKENLDQKLKIIVGGGLTLGLIAAGYYFYTSEKPKDKNNNQNLIETQELIRSVPKSVNNTKAEELLTPQKHLIKIINSIRKLQTESNKITPEMIKSIYKSQFELSEKQFVETTKKFRNRRRQELKNYKNYKNLVAQGSEAIQNIHNNNLNAILAHFGIDKGHWTEIVSEWSKASQQNKEQWDDLLVEMDSKELDAVRNKNKPILGYNVMIDVLKFKCKIISKLKNNEIEGIRIDEIQDKTFVFDLVQKYAFDSIYEEFKIEEEDITYFIKNYSEKEKLAIEKYENEATELLQNIVFGQDHDSEENY